VAALITDTFLGWIASLAEWAADLMPTWTPNIPSAGPIASYLDDLNYFLPIGEVIAVVLVVLALGLPLGAVSLSLWVGIGIIRGGASRG
jgi:hypothetical protein